MSGGDNEREKITRQKAQADYGILTTDLKRPIILEQDGQPAAVILPFERYLRLRELETSEEERRRAAWTQLNALVENVHRRSSTYTEQIETEIATARAEVKEMRRARRSRR